MVVSPASFFMAASGAASFDPTLIGNSVWVDGSADYLNKTPSAGTTTRWIWSSWVQRTEFGANDSSAHTIFSAGSSLSNLSWIRFDDADHFDFGVYQGATTARKTSSAKYRDIGWYHLCISFDSGSGVTASDRIKLFVNGIEVTELSANTDTPSGETTAFNGNVLHEIGRYTYNGIQYYQGYLAQFTMLENKSFQNSDLSITDLLDSFTFGTNGSQFTPKADADIASLASSAGGNSFCLDFANSSDLGNDISSNNNDYTPNSMAAVNQSTNTPSLVYPKISNIGTPSGDAAASYTMGLGSNRMVYSGGNQVSKGLISTTLIKPEDPKIYWEFYVEAGSVGGSSGGRLGNGIAVPHFNAGNGNGFYGAGGESAYFQRGTLYDNGNSAVSGFTYPGVGGVQNFAFEPSTGKVWIGVNGTWRNGSATDSTTLDIDNYDDQLTVQDYVFIIGAQRSGDIGVMNFGDNPTFSGNETAGTNADENGHGLFAYAVPSGFLAPNSANLTAPDAQGVDHFQTKLYTGSNASQNVTGFDFNPAFLWIKNRNVSGESHHLMDAVRGDNKFIHSNSSAVERTGSLNNGSNALAFITDGFSITNASGSADELNLDTRTYVSWAWANDGTRTANTNGAKNIFETVSTPGHFAIFDWDGDSTAGAFQHSMGDEIEMIIVKRRNVADWNWYVWHKAIPDTKAYLLDTSDSGHTSTYWNDVAVNAANQFTLGATEGINKTGDEIISYAFRSVPGVCKVGSYTGNGDGTGSDTVDGPYVSCGFKPRWIMFRWTTGGSLSGEGWVIKDTARQTVNPNDDAELIANTTGAEAAGATHGADILSDGFKLRGGGGAVNKSGATYIYLAMADIGGNGTLPPIYGR